MRYVLSTIFGAVAYILFPIGIFSIPFSQLTLENIFRLVGAVAMGVMAIVELFEIGLHDE